MKLTIIGFKGTGKTTIGKMLSERLDVQFYDLDELIEELYESRFGRKKTYREIFKESEQTFRSFEIEGLSKVPCDAVLAVGGSTPLKNDLPGKKVLLIVEKESLYKRIIANGIPAFFDISDPRGSFDKLYQERMNRYESIADLKINNDLEPEKAVEAILSSL